MKYAAFILTILFNANIFAQTPVIQNLRSYREKNEQQIYSDFISFLKIPNVATDIVNIVKNADFLVAMMKKKGIENVQLLDAGLAKAPPSVYGEVNVPGATKTIIFYAHYDGQPVNPATWAKGLHPFLPQLVNGRIDENGVIQSTPNFPLNDDFRIYARGSSDDKGGIMAILTAFSAIKESGIKFPYNIKFFFEGEEEQGSPNLPQILEKHKQLLQSDLWIICDGPVHQSGRKQVVFGVRGDTHLTLKVFGPKNPLHSGHYGNWVPNPVMTLARLLASMKDDEGRVTVKNFYDDVIALTDEEKKAIATAPNIDADLKKKIGFSKEEMSGASLAQAINLPSLNINGIESSNVGTIGANVIPTSATAVLDLRLVLGNDWKKQQQKVIAHIKQQGFYVTTAPPTDEERATHQKIVQVTESIGGNAERTPMSWPLAKKITAAMQQVSTDSILQVPTLGGSLPLEAFVKVLGAKFLIVPIANADNNQHAENENIRIKNFRDGIDIMAAIMLMKL